MLKITVNIGFITNSSSVVFHFPKELLEFPKVKTFMEKYGIIDGFVGYDLWSRQSCSSLLVNQQQFQEANVQFQDAEYKIYAPAIDDTKAAIIYGDEYETITSELAKIIEECAKENNISVSSSSYN